jgi:hypothetical protein
VIAMSVPAEKKSGSPLDPGTWAQHYEPGEDKEKHALAGFAITLATFVFLTTLFQVSKVKTFIACALVAVSSAVIALYLKEAFYDGYLHLGQPDIWDFICGLALIPLAIILISIYGYILWSKKALK